MALHTRTHLSGPGASAKYKPIGKDAKKATAKIQGLAVKDPQAAAAANSAMTTTTQ
jgi:hypothetical protein